MACMADAPQVLDQDQDSLTTQHDKLAEATGSPSMSLSWCKTTLQTRSYLEQQRKFWPREGNHILAQYDENSVVVYQAFRPEIADYAVKHQQFGGDQYSFSRMSWIKTNFLWMMYRCGWAGKKNQERVLAIWIPRQAFETILSSAYTALLQKSKGMTKDDILVRLQWDPDHTPTYNKCERRAIQLGMKGEILRKFGTEWALKIEDITKFVREQKHILDKKGEDHLITPVERVYQVNDPKLAAHINLDVSQPSQSTVVVVGGSEKLPVGQHNERQQNVAESVQTSK